MNIGSIIGCSKRVRPFSKKHASSFRKACVLSDQSFSQNIRCCTYPYKQIVKMSNLPSLDSSVCVHLPKCLQTGQGDRVYDCHFVRRVTRKYFSVSGKPEWCRRMNRNVGPKGGFLSKRQSRNVFLIGRVRCKNSFLGPFESHYTPLFCFVTVRPAKSSK